MPDHRLRELRRFFTDYKKLENKDVRVQDFFGPERAKTVLNSAIEKYNTDILPEKDGEAVKTEA
jgi:inorganic pyrophosphatase